MKKVVKNKKPVNIVYLLGAGRSGTTLLSTILNSHPKIKTLGEMHQFPSFLKKNKSCSCGMELRKCPFWGEMINSFDNNGKEIQNSEQMLEMMEKHYKIPFLLFKKKENKEYTKIQNKIFKTIAIKSPNEWLLDSSKYVARYLLLRKNEEQHIKGIYVVRDVRGVINSFGKQVQTPKNPISTILYYLSINFFAQIVSWTDKNVIKIKYEDLIDSPEIVFGKIYEHICEGTKNTYSLPDTFEIPHFIGGNRMVKRKVVQIKKDMMWKRTISRPKQILYYLLSVPIMLVNGYKI